MENPFTERYDKLVADTLQRWHFPGVSIAVVKGDRTWTKGYGIALQDSKTPVDATTLFYVASTTKAHLCAAWGLYMESEANKNKPKDQRITWSTPLADIIRDDFVLSDPIRTVQVTLEDAVSHRTGIPRHELSYGYEGVRTTRDLTRNLRNLYFHNELRTKFEYCNTPFVAASHALETVTGKPLAEYMREKLWGPIGMDATFGGYSDAAKCVKDRGLVLAKGTVWSKFLGDPKESEGTLVEEDHMDFPEISGAGWAISNADDYAKWMRAWLDTSSSPLSEDLKKELWLPRSIVPPDEAYNAAFEGTLTYALGWFVSTYKGHMLYWHPGGIIGAGSYLLLCPDLKFGVTLLANGQDASFKLKNLATDILDEAISIPENDRILGKKCDEHVYALYKKFAGDMEKARDKMYPAVADHKPTPHALPLEAYCGIYHNPAYARLKVTMTKSEDGHDALLCDFRDRTWKNTIVLEHINAELWFGQRGFLHSPLRVATRGESKIGADGKVAAFGLTMEPAMPDTLSWFERSDQ
jgi:CubicO group peptidase (beta-lactamase class C family)